MKKIFKKAKHIRETERKVAKFYAKSGLKVPIYLSIGQEVAPAVISEYFKPDRIFAQHRAMAWAIAYGMTYKDIKKQLTGSTGNECIHNEMLNGHHGLLGEQAPIAVGHALSGKKTLCVMGDGGAEEDYVYPALGFAATHKLPILFIVDDNNLAILTKKNVRRKWEIARVAKSIGIKSCDIPDNPYLIKTAINMFKDNLPALINIRSIRHHWHNGPNKDGEPEYDRLENFK